MEFVFIVEGMVPSRYPELTAATMGVLSVWDNQIEAEKERDKQVEAGVCDVHITRWEVGVGNSLGQFINGVLV